MKTATWKLCGREIMSREWKIDSHRLKLPVKRTVSLRITLYIQEGIHFRIHVLLIQKGKLLLRHGLTEKGAGREKLVSSSSKFGTYARKCYDCCGEQCISITDLWILYFDIFHLLLHFPCNLYRNVLEQKCAAFCKGHILYIWPFNKKSKKTLWL